MGKKFKGIKFPFYLIVSSFTLFTAISLSAQPLVTLSGTIADPPHYDGAFEVRVGNLDGRDGTNPPFADVNQEAQTFQIEVPPGKYYIQVSGEGFWTDEGQWIGGLGAFFTYTSVDATQGDVTDVQVPVPLPNGRINDTAPPIAALISVGEANESGIALVTGEPGAASGPATVVISNLQTGQYGFGVSNSDGSFAIPMFAPAGSYLSVHHDTSGLVAFGLNASVAPGTIIRVLVEDEENGAFATGAKLAGNGDFDIRRLAEDGGVDVGQIWFWGTVADRNWSAGSSGSISGTAKIYSRNLTTATPSLVGNPVYLERIFDVEGKQEIASPEQASHFLTPSGLPIERRNSQDPIEIGWLELGEFIQTSDRSGETTWTLNYQLPADLPNGTYQLIIAAGGDDPIGFSVEGLEKGTLYTEDVFPHYFDKLFSTGGATIINVNSNPNPRLSWALGMNELSNGSRGTVALDDRDRLAIAGHVKTNSRDLVLPAVNPRTGESYSYRIEPWAPLIGSGNRSWINPPTVPFDFSSSQLTVQIEAPDGTIQDLGTVPIAQPFVQETTGPAGNVAQGNNPRQYYGLTTLNPDFTVSFDQYGLHVITMTGYIDDIFGTRYEAGGTYEVYIAKPLDLEFGVFPNTPFDVGDQFAPSLITQPGVPADVDITISHYPFSDTSQAIVRTISGRANRFGYFHPFADSPYVFDEPGEYRVDYKASFVDDDGVMWMGSRSWGSVVATPDSQIITRGRRGGDIGEVATRPQWFNIKGNVEVEGSHLHFPFSAGDVVWMEDSFQEQITQGNPTAMLLQVSLQDPTGRIGDYYRQRAPNWPLFPTVSNTWDIENRITLGELPLFSSSPNGLSPLLNPEATGNHWAYFYAGAARPGVAVREAVLEDDAGNSYWRFDGDYNYQLGVGANGDLPNDFKFLFGGAVYRAPDEDFYYYGSYGGLWVMVPHDDPTGGRTMPPFQGAAGGPSGGPIMTLKGEDIDMFFHPMGVRAGTILEVGDVAAFSGQIAPTLPSKVSITVTTPGGNIHVLEGQANNVGYFYAPETDFAVEESGVYTVDVNIWHDGNTSAGPVEAPFPTGGVLGAINGQFEFYVVQSDTSELQVDLPESSIVRPGQGPVPVQLSGFSDLDNPQLYFTAVMPGVILEQGSTGGSQYIYDAPKLAADFLNLDTIDQDQRTGVDTITLSFLVSGTNEQGHMEYRPRQILMQGEELLALESSAPVANLPPETSIVIAATYYPDSDALPGESVQLTGQVSDGDGSIAAIEWLIDDVVVATGLTPTLSLADGTTVITFKATDNDGASSTANVTISVESPNKPPVVSILDGDRTIQDSDDLYGEKVGFSATAIDTDGSIASTEWLINNSVIASGLTPDLSLPDGASEIVFRATDDEGASSSAAATITVVEPAPNPPPRRTFRADGIGTNAVINAGISKDNGLQFASSFQVGDTIQILARLQPEQNDIGEIASIYVIAAVGPSYLLVTPTGILPWDGALGNLIAFKEVELANGYLLDVLEPFGGSFTLTENEGGSYLFFIAYATSDGVITYTDEPFLLDVEQ